MTKRFLGEKIHWYLNATLHRKLSLYEYQQLCKYIGKAFDKIYE